MRKILVLGTGCPKCRQLCEAAETAVRESGIGCTIEKVTDLNDILAFGVMMTPALVVDGEVKVMGKVPSVEEIKTYLS
jgi:small redox-active disulfide protein 2